MDSDPDIHAADLSGLLPRRTEYRIGTTILFFLLSLFVLWFALQPGPGWETKYLGITADWASADIGNGEIFQTLSAPVGIRGIKVRFSSRDVQLNGPLIFKLYDSQGREVDQTFLPPEDIRTTAPTDCSDAYTDIIFPAPHEAGDYMVGVTGEVEGEGRLSIYESELDNYKDGDSIDAGMERKNCDWAFLMLVPYPETMMTRHRVLRAVGIILAVLLFGCGLAVVFGKQPARETRLLKKTKQLLCRRKELIFILMLLLMPVLLYLDFLTGDRCLIFSKIDRGVDSCAQTYPTLLYFARRLSSGKISGLFNFFQGLGTAEKGFFPTLTNWIAVFGQKHTACMMAVSQLIKVAGSGIFAFWFAKEFGTGSIFAFIAAAGYEFNSMVIDRGAWETYPNLSLLVIVWLFAYELSRKKKRYLFFCLATLLFFTGIVLFDCIFYGGLLLGYLLLRNLLLDVSTTDKASFGEQKKRRVLKECGLYILFFLLGSLDTVRSSLLQVIGSSRMKEGTGEFLAEAGTKIWSDISVWMTAFLRTVGHSICGITENTGYNSLLSGPAFYCGILALLLLPLSLYLMKGRKKAGYLLCLAAGAFYIACIPFRMLISGFMDNFKLSSFWITLVFFLLLLELFAILHRGEDFGKGNRILLITAVLSGILLALAWLRGYVLDKEAFVCTAFLLVFYTLILKNGNPLKSRTMTALLVIGVCVEGFCVTENIISDRDTWSKMEMTVTGYQDQAAGAISTLLEEDKDWYRIDRQYDSVFMADSLAQGYYGTESYVGGTEIDSGILDLYEHYDLPRQGNHYLHGSSGNIYFASLAGVRYFLTRDSYISRYGYQFLRGDGEVNIYRNDLALPVFYLTENDSIPSAGREKYLEKGTLFPCQVGENGFFYFQETAKDGVLFFDMQFHEEGYSCLMVRNINGEVIQVPFMMREECTVEVLAENIEAAWLPYSAVKKLDSAAVYSMDPQLYYDDFVNETQKECFSAREITVPDDRTFKGIVSGDKDQYLVTVIPYHAKWKILVDGTEQKTIPVRGGFLGTKVSPGEHSVEIIYEGESWISDHFFKLAGGLLLVLYIISRKLLERTFTKEKAG